MTHDLEFRVYGTPGAQGSKRHVGGGRMIESSKKVKPWRAAVETSAQQALAMTDTPPFDGPVAVHVRFIIGRPKSHYGTGTNATRIKATAPVYATSRACGDVEKLVRSTHDAITSAEVWTDDSLVARVTAEKVYGDTPGAEIRIAALQETA
jgi:crossover junction endodeoxyribonuclease RusA